MDASIDQAAQFLQHAVGTRDDGLVGPLTLGALAAALERESPGALAGRLARQLVAFYCQLEPVRDFRTI